MIQTFQLQKIVKKIAVGKLKSDAFQQNKKKSRFYLGLKKHLFSNGNYFTKTSILKC